MSDEEIRQVRNKGVAWTHLVNALKSSPGSNVCWKCGNGIDMSLANGHPMQWTADHVQSMANGGAALQLSNLKPAHRSCNSKRGRALQDFRASRDW